MTIGLKTADASPKLGPAEAEHTGTTSPRRRYAFLGPTGTFTDSALRNFTNVADADRIPCSNVGTALDLVRQNEADFAVVPIENSVEGGVTATLDALAAGDDLSIVGETLLPVSFTLCARTGVTLEQVRRVATHPHAWAQCRQWMSTHVGGAVYVPAASTAAAAAMLAADGPEPAFDAALCSALSARQHGLTVLAEGVADNARAVTRFILVTRPGSAPQPTGSDKTTLVVQLADNEVGALLRVLEQFATRGVNLSRIESRPIGDALGRYSFSIDTDGHIVEERMQATLMGLHRVSPNVQFLGSYPRADVSHIPIRRGTQDSDFRKAQDWVSSLLENRAT